MKNNKTRFFYFLYSDKTWIFDQSEHAYYLFYILNIYIVYIYVHMQSETVYVMIIYSFMNISFNEQNNNIVWTYWQFWGDSKDLLLYRWTYHFLVIKGIGKKTDAVVKHKDCENAGLSPVERHQSDITTLSAFFPLKHYTALI